MTKSPLIVSLALAFFFPLNVNSQDSNELRKAGIAAYQQNPKNCATTFLKLSQFIDETKEYRRSNEKYYATLDAIVEFCKGVLLVGDSATKKKRTFAAGPPIAPYDTPPSLLGSD
jgi:hypothetical protein